MRPHHQRHRSKKSSKRIIHVTLQQVATIPSTKTNITVDDKANPKSTADNFEYLSKLATYSNNQNALSLSKSSQINRSEKVNNTWANWNDYEKKSDRNKKKKKKCVNGGYFAIVLVILLTLIATVVIPLSVLLPETKEKEKYLNQTVVVRWNRTGITVAGVTGQYGNASNLLFEPRGAYMDWSNTMYIADYKNNRVQKYLMGSSFGETVAGQASGSTGSGPSVLSAPYDAQSDHDGNIYVPDTNNHRIQLWNRGSSTGITIAGITGVAGTSVNLLNKPYGIEYDFNTKGIYVSDTNNFRIIYFSAGAINGTVITGANGMGISNTQLHNQYDLYLDTKSNSILIPNCGANNVVRSVPGALNWTLVAGYLNGSTSTTATGFSCPRGVILDPMGNMYVADRDNHRVQYFPVGERVGITVAGTTGLSGSNSSLLNWPIVVMLDNQLNLYVTDSLNHRVQKFLRF